MKTSFSQKKGWVKYFSIILLHLMLIIADLVSTYIGTPDLAMEANPLVSQFGLGWTTLIVGNIIWWIFISIWSYFPFVQYKRSIIPCEGRKEYMSMFLFDHPDKKHTWFSFKIPKNKFNWIAHLGYTITVAVMVTRLYVVLMNILATMYNRQPCIFGLLKIPHTYCNMIHFHTNSGQIFLPIVTMAIVFVTAFITYKFWINREYNINKKALDNLNY